MSVFLLSGGLDSVVLMHWVVRQPYLFGLPRDEAHVAVHFRTGLNVDDVLSEYCRYHCSRLGVRLDEIDLGWVWKPGTRARGEAPPDRESPVVTATLPPDDPYWEADYDYQDGRGILFLTHCCITASNEGMKDVFLGYQQEEEEEKAGESGDSTLVDTSPEFAYEFSELMDTGGFLPSRRPVIRMPYCDLGMRKRHIYQLGLHLGVEMDKTLSCEFTSPPCGKCNQCVRRERAVLQAGGGL